MFRVIFLLSWGIVFGCENYYFPNSFDGCNFDSLVLVNPSSGFVIAGENCGIEIDKRAFFEQPYLFFSEATDFKRYTLVMIDKDNPATGDGRVYLHWLVNNIDGQSLKYGLGTYSGDTVAAYVPPDPLPNTCVHRYTIYIFEQHSYPLQYPELSESREEFNLADYLEIVASENGICAPVASVEFQARF